MRRFLTIIIFLAASNAPAQAPIEKDIVYGTGGGQTLQLDICKPKGEGPFPAVVCIHGGAWQAGNRMAHHATIRQRAQEGFVAATITYRLAPKHVWPAQIEDAKCAIRYVRSKAKEWNIDPNRIAVLGDSAGGHLSLLVGLMNEGFEGTGGNSGVSSRVQAVVNYYGPTDFPSWTIPPTGEMLLKLGAKKDSKQMIAEFLGTSDKKADVMKAASPITYISKDDPPILTFNGTADPLVPDQQARVLHEALEKSGVVNRMEILENAAHGWGEPLRTKTNQITVEFLKKALK